MSLESAKAFCVRLMADDEFRGKIGSCATAAEIVDALKAEAYDFSRHDLLKVIGELNGQPVEMEQLTAMVCDVYEQEIKSGKDGSVEAVKEWLSSLR